MNLTQLTYFQHLAKRQHLLQTAESLHVSPSTVSASLKSLEEELGTPLFDRKGRGMRLNRQGQIFLPYVDQLFSLLAQGEQAVRESLGQQPRDFSFSLKYTAFYHDIVPLLLNLYPQMTIHHYDMDTDDRGSLMWEKDLDLMITAKDFSANSKLTYETISVDPFCLAVNPEHWLAARKSCRLEELRGEIFLHRPKDSYYQFCVDAMLEQCGFRPSSTQEVSYMTRPVLLRAFPYVAVTTMQTMTTPLFAGLHTVQVEEFAGHTYELRAYWRRNRPVHPASTSLIRILRSFTPGTSQPAQPEEK